MWRKLDKQGQEKILSVGVDPTAPFVRVRMSADQSIANTTESSVLFDTEDIDTHGMHDPSSNTNRLTCRVAGIYLVWFQATWATSSGGGERMARINKNAATGVNTAGNRFAASTSASLNEQPVLTVMELVPGDYVAASVFQGNGAALLLTHDATQFGMVRIGPPLLVEGARVTYGSTFPLSPANGDEHNLDTGTAGVVWRFRYNANSASSYKWEFIGGPPLCSYDSADRGTSHNDNSWTATSSDAISIANPRPGEYIVRASCSFRPDSFGCTTWMGVRQGSTDPTIEGNLSTAGYSGVASARQSLNLEGKATETGTGTAFAMRTRQASGSSQGMHRSGASISLTPVRCS